MFTYLADSYHRNIKKIAGVLIFFFFFISAGSGAVYVQLYLIKKLQGEINGIIAHES
ncbi:hypothetical protein ACFL47_07035 [Candidatus Latescibacterota bacterium]